MAKHRFVRHVVPFLHLVDFVVVNLHRVHILEHTWFRERHEGIFRCGCVHDDPGWLQNAADLFEFIIGAITMNVHKAYGHGISFDIAHIDIIDETNCNEVDCPRRRIC